MITLAGLFLVPAPGPGWVVIFVGLGMLAAEFLLLARFLDWAEVKSRGLAQRAKGIWMDSSTAVKILLSLVILIGIGALGYGAYYLIFGSGYLEFMEGLA